MLTKISFVTLINKYFKYLSESPEMNSLGPEHVSGPRLFMSGVSDNYFKYLLINVTRIRLNQTGKLSFRDTAFMHYNALCIVHNSNA